MNLRYYNNTHIDINDNNYCINIKDFNDSIIIIIMTCILLTIFIRIFMKINKLFKKE